MIIPASLRPLRVRVALLLVLTVSIILTQIPLFNYLGYEFSVVLAFTLCLVIAPLSIGTYRSQAGNQHSVSLRDFWGSFKEQVFVSSFLLSIPLIVMTINMVSVKNCAYVEGIGFFLLLPGVTTIFSVALAGLCFMLFRRPLLAYYMFTVLILARVPWLGYYTPQIYAYNLILGYFPGLSYDEVLTISPTLIYFRLFTLIVALCCLSISVLLTRTVSLHDGVIHRVVGFVNEIFRRRDGTTSVFFLTSLVLIAVWTFRVHMGFETSVDAIEGELRRAVGSDHVVVRYAEGTFADEEKDWVVAEHEFQLQRVARRLQVVPSGVVMSYMYPSEESQRRFIGAGATNIAKPWRSEIHMNISSWSSVLHHELVHVLAGKFGMPVIRAHYNIGLVEGLAMAVAWDFGNRTLHEYAAAIERFGLVDDLGRMFSSVQFAMQAPSVSYVVAGSFCRFLIDRYGMPRMKELYAGGSFVEVYGKRMELLLDEWKHFLRRIPVQDEWKPHIQFYFHRPSIFTKECARAVARLNEQGEHELRDNNPAEALETFGMSLREHWNSPAFFGLIRAAHRLSRYDTVVAMMEVKLQDNFYSVAPLLLTFGDALWATGNLRRAKTVYEDALRIDLSEASNEATVKRLVALEHRVLRHRLRSYFVGTDSDSAKGVLLEEMLREIDHPLLRLLRAEQFYRRRNYAKALEELEHVKGVDDRTLLHLREKLSGMCYLYRKQFQEARAHFWFAKNYTTNEASHLRLDEWLDRCEWLDERWMRNRK